MAPDRLQCMASLAFDHVNYSPRMHRYLEMSRWDMGLGKNQMLPTPMSTQRGSELIRAIYLALSAIQDVFGHVMGVRIDIASRPSTKAVNLSTLFK